MPIKRNVNEFNTKTFLYSVGKIKQRKKITPSWYPHNRAKSTLFLWFFWNLFNQFQCMQKCFETISCHWKLKIRFWYKYDEQFNAYLKCISRHKGPSCRTSFKIIARQFRLYIHFEIIFISSFLYIVLKHHKI